MGVAVSELGDSNIVGAVTPKTKFKIEGACSHRVEDSFVGTMSVEVEVYNAGVSSELDGAAADNVKAIRIHKKKGSPSSKLMEPLM